MSEIDEELIRRASGGDVDAFEKIYRAHSGFVYNVAYRVLGHKEDAEEVTQEVFVNVYRKLNTFEFQSALKTWIYRMTVNSAINYAKKRSRYTDRHMEYDGRQDAAAPQSPAEDVVEREGREQMLNDMLAELNEDQRACLILRAVQGLSYEEIAQTLDININTVRTRLKRAREKMLALRSGVNSYGL